jgi:hypothetical protein
VRWAAVEAVQRNCEPSIKDVRERIVARRGKDARTAKVAAGRVMLEAVYYLLRDGECRPSSLTEPEADTHNRIAADAGSQQSASTRRPQHRSSSRFALRALRVDPAPLRNAAHGVAVWLVPWRSCCCEPP